MGEGVKSEMQILTLYIYAGKKFFYFVEVRVRISDFLIQVLYVTTVYALTLRNSKVRGEIVKPYRATT